MQLSIVFIRLQAAVYKFFSSFNAAYIFYFFTLSKGIDDAPPFLGYVLWT